MKNKFERIYSGSFLVNLINGLLFIVFI